MSFASAIAYAWRTNSSFVMSFLSVSGEPDQVLAGEWSTELLHPTSFTQAPKIDDVEAGVAEQRRDLLVGLGVVAGQEDHALTTRVAGIGTEYAGRERVG